APAQGRCRTVRRRSARLASPPRYPERSFRLRQGRLDARPRRRPEASKARREIRRSARKTIGAANGRQQTHRRRCCLVPRAPGSPRPLRTPSMSPLGLFHRRNRMKLLPKAGLAIVAAAVALTVSAQDLTGTLKKIKDSGTIVLGTRESSGALAYTLGDGKYVGFHTEMGEHIAKDIQRDLKMPKLDIKYQP